MKLSIRALKTFAQSRLGKLGWSTLVVFIILRSADIMNLICKLILGRMLTETDFGAIDPILSLLAVFSIPLLILFQTGVKSLSRLGAAGQPERRQALTRDMLRLSFVGSAASFVAIILLQRLILTRLHLEGTFYILLIAVLVSISWFSLMYRAIIQGTHQYRLLSVPIILRATIFLSLTLIFLVGLHWRLKGALSALVIADILTLGVVLFILRPFFKVTKASYTQELGYIKRSLLPMAIYVGSCTVLYNFDRLFVRNFLLEHSGGYGALTTLGSIPSFIMGSLVFVVFPMASAEHAKKGDITAFYRQALWIGLSIVLLSTAFFACTAKPLMTLWNPVFEPDSNYLWLYALATGLYGMIQIIASVEIARHQYRFLWFVAVPTLVMCVLLYFNSGALGIRQIITSVLATRILILFGIWLHSRLKSAST